MHGTEVDATAAAPGESVPLFLVSHVSGDDDAYVDEFFRDLCRAVAEVAGIAQHADVGVLANIVDPGAEAWPALTAAALARCPIFLPLCTPRLLLSQSAGRHWWIFRERLERSRADD